jgi:hypothetical protein
VAVRWQTKNTVAVMKKERKQPLTFEEHVELGRKLKGIMAELVQIHFRLERAYPIAEFEQNFRKVDSRLNAIRSKLDSKVCGMFPLSIDAVDGRKLTHVYYGPVDEGASES